MKKENEMVAHHKKQVCLRATTVFTETANLDEAAGTLLNLDPNERRHFFEELLRGRAFAVHEKLKMILRGGHRGVRLMNGWNMSRRRMNALRNVYKA